MSSLSLFVASVASSCESTISDSPCKLQYVFRMGYTHSIGFAILPRVFWPKVRPALVLNMRGRIANFVDCPLSTDRAEQGLCDLYTPQIGSRARRADAKGAAEYLVTPAPYRRKASPVMPCTDLVKIDGGVGKVW